MKKRIKNTVFRTRMNCGFFVKLLVLTFCIFGAFFPLNTIAAEKLNLGMIDPSPSKMIKRFTPLLNYLNSKGVPTGKVVTAKTLDQMNEYLNTGEVDFIFESPYGAVEMMDKAGAVPILIREKDGTREYKSVIFVKKDSPIKDFSSLIGKVVAFEDGTSTSSFIMPKIILETAGLKLKESNQPNTGVISYYFSKDDDNTIAQVKAGDKANAGGINKRKVEGNSDFRLLYPESAYVPRHVVLVRKDVSSDKLARVLLNMKNDPAAADVLKEIQTPTGFSEFKGDPSLIMNTTVRKALGL